MDTLTYAATLTWNCNFLKMATLTLTGNCNLTISGHVAGGTYQLKLIQDATGSRSVTWNNVKWYGGIASQQFSSAGNAIDFITFTSDGTNLWANTLKAFS